MLSARHNDAHIRPKHHRHLPNPADQAAVKAGSIDVFGGMEKVQDLTQGSGASAMSDLSALENETDDFGRKLIQHQRDAQRLSNMRENPRAFKKARPRPRIAERLEREERESMQQAEREHPRVSSGGSNDSEPPVTVPREWGRKARRQNDWMKKIREPSVTSKTETDEVKADADLIYPRRTSHAYSGDENPLLEWDTVDRPLQSVENTPPSMRRRAQLPTPSSMNHMNTTLKLGDESEDGDFNAASMLASTPAARLPRKIDELTRREIESIERKGLTTRALDYIDEMSPNATRRASRNSLRDQALADGMESSPSSPTRRPITAPAAKVTSPSKIPRRPGSAIGNNKENLPFSEANNSYKSARTTGLSDRTAHAVSTKSTAQQASSRPGHKRNDSMGLLRRLARVSSMSPSPARDKPVSPGKAKDTGDRLGSPVEKEASQAPAKGFEFGPDAALDVHETVGRSDDRAQQQSYFKNHEPRNEADDPDATPMPPAQIQDARTPVVAGAGVETTLQADAQNASAPSNAGTGPGRRLSRSESKASKQERGKSEDDLRRTTSEISSRRSALDDIVYQARHGDNTQQYGENTMASLENIAHPDLEQTDPTITFDYDALKREQEEIDDDRILTQDDKNRRQADLAVEAMDKHLRAARTSIKDAKRGLRRVENRIDTASEHKTLTTITTTSNAPPTILASTSAQPHVYCTCHSRNAGGAWWTLWTEFRSLFYTSGTEPATDYSFLTIRPTWLGLAVLLWLTWYLSETTLCSYFCNPRFASWVDDYPDPNAPVFPFVIPTLVFRPLRWAWQPVCHGMAWAVGAAFHWLFGDSSSSARPPRVMGVGQRAKKVGVGKGVWKTASRTGLGREWAATATTVGKRVVESVVDVLDEAGSMWDDERLG